jgi:3-dehydroquinate synthetase
VADLASLETLPAREWGTGLAEIIKCAIIGDPPLLDAVDGLAPGSGSKSWKDAVAAAARIKVRIVAEDPLEASVRAILNLGHTVGHALEAASGYALSHGAAVSVGIRAAGLLAQTQGWWPARDHARVLRSLKIAGLPLAAQGLAVDAVMAAVKRDKKNAGGGFRFVLPVRIGEVRYGIDVSEPTVRAAVAAVVEAPPASELGP